MEIVWRQYGDTMLAADPGVVSWCSPLPCTDCPGAVGEMGHFIDYSLDFPNYLSDSSEIPGKRTQRLAGDS
jgi:hypothetical protein